ncbi:FHA domain-containing protein [Botrimarina hoheduenensis]|uniref:FHA domain-containing protein FhaA n=1 Tax=Botrimarina hoheduenensis TaxID=2528000 RepID=A0A5C5WB53_9BACT|nr:FHA domain-containing protein [Botrimarina hoheduenensis]TWT47241.1 FHA domain-containing protein FhaA [Botrimarina hoheduenensis]
MARITLQVLDGADRGVIYEDLETPVTIGREEGNAVQLNDERISRYHIKIQEDRDRIVLTDLESTNGTRVNGQTTQLRILQHGDLIAVGKSTLLYGTRAQIAERVDAIKDGGLRVSEDAKHEPITGPARDPSGSNLNSDESISIELDWGDSARFPSALHLPGPPDLPEGLSPAQAAQVSELFEYFHLRCRSLLSGVTLDESGEPTPFDRERWQELVDLQALLAQYLRRIGEGG